MKLKNTVPLCIHKYYIHQDVEKSFCESCAHCENVILTL